MLKVFGGKTICEAAIDEAVHTALCGQVHGNSGSEWLFSQLLL